MSLLNSLTISPGLTDLLAKSPFLTLISSQEALPGSRGTGLPLLKLQTPRCNALIALQGAHLLTFTPTNGPDLLWLSPNCDFTPGTALRGGIPLCLPWFGPNLLDSSKPKHGFARNRDWELSAANLDNHGIATLTFTFNSHANPLFEHDFSANLNMELGDSIKLTLTINNTGATRFGCSWVMHNYFPIESLSTVRVKGLAGRTYLDNLSQHAAFTQDGDVSFPAEVDRVYPGIENPIEIVGTPAIRITHGNCPSVVVWNPGSANAAKIADIGAGNEQGYICVERGAALPDTWELAAGDSRSAWMEIAAI